MSSSFQHYFAPLSILGRFRFNDIASLDLRRGDLRAIIFGVVGAYSRGERLNGLNRLHSAFCAFISSSQCTLEPQAYTLPHHIAPATPEALVLQLPSSDSAVAHPHHLNFFFQAGSHCRSRCPLNLRFGFCQGIRCATIL
jgi:hypothetical protein